MTVAHAHTEHCSVLAAEVTLCCQLAAKHLVCVKRLKRDNVTSVVFKAWLKNWRQFTLRHSHIYSSLKLIYSSSSIPTVYHLVYDCTIYLLTRVNQLLMWAQ